jgi:hypothetical protein
MSQFRFVDLDVTRNRFDSACDDVTKLGAYYVGLKLKLYSHLQLNTRWPSFHKKTQQRSLNFNVQNIQILELNQAQGLRNKENDVPSCFLFQNWPSVVQMAVR